MVSVDNMGQLLSLGHLLPVERGAQTSRNSFTNRCLLKDNTKYNLILNLILDTFWGSSRETIMVYKQEPQSFFLLQRMNLNYFIIKHYPRSELCLQVLPYHHTGTCLMNIV